MVRLAHFLMPFSWCVILLIDDWRVASRCALSVAWSVEINGMF